MVKELLLAAFIIGVGLCVAGAGTHLYQWLSRQRAMLRYDGGSFIASMGNVALSFVCGPYIMLQLGWQQEGDSQMPVSMALVAAMVAFGWAFITGLLFMGAYVAIRY